VDIFLYAYYSKTSALEESTQTWIASITLRQLGVYSKFSFFVMKIYFFLGGFLCLFFKFYQFLLAKCIGVLGIFPVYFY
jgi:hypothetical protein